MGNYFTNITKEEDGLYLGIVYDATTSQEVTRTEKNVDQTVVILSINSYIKNLANNKGNPRPLKNVISTPNQIQNTTPKPPSCRVCGG